MKVAIDGIEINVSEDQFHKLVEKLEKKNVQIDNLEGWQTKVTHEPYDFNIFVNKAKEYSDKNPPDVVQFSEKAWDAAAICINEFFLKRFGILIKSHSAKRNLLTAICAGLGSKQSGEIMSTWTKAEKSHSNFYWMEFVAKEDRESLLESIKQMAAIIEQADMNLINADLKSLKSVTLKNVQKGVCKIGNNSYDYNCIAY